MNRHHMDGLTELLNYFKNVPIAKPLETISVVIIYITLISLSIKFILIPFYKYVLSYVFNFFIKINQLPQSVEMMKKELTTNGGSSLKDLVIKINQQTTYLINQTQKTSDEQNAMLHFMGLGNHCNNWAFMKVNTDGDCIFTTSYFHNLTGLSDEDAYGKGWLNAIYSEDRDRVFREWYTSVSQKRAFNLDFSVTKQKIPIKCYVIPVRNESDVIVGYIAGMHKYDNNKISDG